MIPIESQRLADEEGDKDIIKPEERTGRHAREAEFAKSLVWSEDVCVEIEDRDFDCCNRRDPEWLDSNEGLRSKSVQCL